MFLHEKTFFTYVLNATQMRPHPKVVSAVYIHKPFLQDLTRWNSESRRDKLPGGFIDIVMLESIKTSAAKRGLGVV